MNNLLTTLTLLANRIIVLIFCVICSIASYAYDFEKDGLYYNILSETTVECCGGGQSPSDATYRKTEVSIPSSVQRGLKTYSVVKIADYAWGQVQYIVWIKNLILPNTIIEIGKGAFRDANNIESINLPEGLKIIGDYALQGPKITEYIFPKSLESIGTRAFNSKLKTVIFTSSNPPTIFEETFAYQNGGMYDIFIPTGFKIFVPSVQSYSIIPYYSKYINPIVSFSEDSFIYSGKKPELNFTVDLPNNHTFSLDTTNLPINAGQYNLIIKGLIDSSLLIDIPLNILIEKANLYIEADNKTRQYGNDNPFLSAKISGLQNNEDIDDVLTNGFHLYTTATSNSDIGEYPICLNSDISTNYIVNFKQGFLNITKAPIGLSVGNYEKEYGTPNPQFNLNFVGLKNGEQIPKWDKSPIFSTEATIESNVGAYEVTVACEPHNYDITTNENGILTITKAPLSINAIPATRKYYEPNPQFNFTLNGLRNNDTKDCLSKQPVFDCLAALNSDCGTYTITPSSAEAQNYDISYEPSILTITPASLTVSAKDLTREYGEDNPILKYELIGLKGNDNVDNVLLTPPILSTTATPSSNVGEYSIIVNGGSSHNYTLSYRSGILTVNKAPLSVIVENADRLYGEANPTFKRSYLGFKLGDTENTAFSVRPTVSCSATKSSNVGEYPIIVSGGISKNYEVMSYENGILTITKATAILTPINKERYYFEDNPSFDFTLSGLRNNDSKSCVTVLPQYTCSATKLSDVGTYTINASGATAANYSFEYGEGSLIVNPRQLTASVGNYSRIYGADNPIFEISYTGFVNNEDATILSKPSVATCSATKLSDVGSYPITLSGGSATNYIISNYNNGTLTIDKADQTITWNQDLSSIELYSQVELDATSTSGLLVSYEMSPNNVATLYSNSGKWYLDCYGSGAVNIRATQNGDKNYNAANTITKTLVVYGGGDDPQNPQIYLNIEEPGTLSTMIADNRKYQIKNLRLTGYLNGTDICFLREMSGSDNIGNSTPGVLETLDISGCTIVEGGRSYYKSSRTTDYVVGDYMFYNCKSLTTLHLPNNSVRIGNNSLADCDRLSVISIPNSVNKIGTEAFKNDISLMRIPMPDALTTIEDLAFMGCNGLSELTIPSEVSVIGDGIVKDCQNIERISVESDNSNFASVDGVLFNKNQDRLIIFPVNHSSNEYTVPEGVKTIAPYAFVNSKNLKSVSLPSSMSIIGQDAFIGCVNLQTLKVKAITPPVCQNDCFESVSKTRCELQVPMGCRSSYWVAPVWSEFNKIVETDFSGIDPVYYNDVHIEITNGKISISGCPNDLIISIYQINGTLLYQSEASDNVVEFKPSSHGVFLVVIGNKTYKVSL